jgi:hypothetical protein
MRQMPRGQHIPWLSNLRSEHPPYILQPPVFSSEGRPLRAGYHTHHTRPAPELAPALVDPQT